VVGTETDSEVIIILYYIDMKKSGKKNEKIVCFGEAKWSYKVMKI